MQTIIIWNTVGEAPVELYLFNEDLIRFHNIYINRFTEDQKELDLQTELNLFFYNEDGTVKEKIKASLMEFGVAKFNEPFRIIRCGFLP